MKITNLAILFVLIACCLLIQVDIKTNNIQSLTDKKVLYDESLDSAIDDAVIHLVELDSKKNLVLNKQESINNFYKSLYANFGVLEDKEKQDLLQLYIPIILITDVDGYYIMFNDEYVLNGSKMISKQWTEKKPYVYEDDIFIYSFSTDDTIRLFDKRSQVVSRGKYQDLALLYPDNQLLNNAGLYDEIRRNTIINLLQDEMNYFTNQNNRIAEHFGVTYNFSLPTIDQTDWNRTIDDISLLVIFQGYPYGIPGEYYNRYSVAGARIRKTSCYYITGEGLEMKYHKEKCNLSIDKEFPYFKKKECAAKGAFPCTVCSP